MGGFTITSDIHKHWENSRYWSIYC